MAGPPEVESTIQRLSEHRNVRGVIILNRDGVVIRSSGPVLQGSDGVIVLRRYASEARKIVDAVGSSVDRMELDVCPTPLPLLLPISLSLSFYLNSLQLI
jgi:dynein light chain roadblock-type